MVLDYQAITELNQLAQPRYQSRVIAIASGKGGVGKTNLSVNLGLALARRNLRVALLDADLGTANADIVLGIHPRYHLHHVVTGQKKLSEIIVEGPFGLKVIPGASGLPDLANLPERQRENLLYDLHSLDGAVDLLLIDTGAGVDRKVVQFIQAAGEVLIVTTPEPTAITDAYALIKILNSYQIALDIKVVINNARHRADGEVAGRKLSSVTYQFLGREIQMLGVIPHDELLERAVRSQSPLLQSFPRSAAAQAINQLSERLWTGVTTETTTKSGGIGRFIKRILSVKSESDA
jgi:flagellar biosynthesis protein FlhG